MELLESDSARPRQARYQAALRPDMKRLSNSTVIPNITAIAFRRYQNDALQEPLTRLRD